MGKIAEMMGGLPMGELIGGPLTAVVSAQRDLAKVMIAYVEDVGYDKDETGKIKNNSARMMKFNMTKPVISDDGKGNVQVNNTDMSFQAPVLGLLPMPSLLVDHVKIGFQMEVTATETEKSNFSAEASADVSAKFLWFSAKVSGKVSTSKENTRSTNQTAKYQVEVEAKQQPPTECMSKLLDMFAQCTEPVNIKAGKTETTDKQA